MAIRSKKAKELNISLTIGLVVLTVKKLGTALS